MLIGYSLSILLWIVSSLAVSPFDEYNRLAFDRVKSIGHSWDLKGKGR